MFVAAAIKDPEKAIFVASSTAAIPQAKKFIAGCQRLDVRFVPWWEHFKAGHTTFDQLLAISKRVQQAAVILTPEFQAGVGDSARWMPNVNVVLEFGLFAGTLGAENVAAVKYGNVTLPSDIHGLVYINGDKEFSKQGRKVTAQTKLEFDRWLGPISPLLADPAFRKLSGMFKPTRTGAKPMRVSE